MAIGASLFALMNLFARLATTSASWSSVGAARAAIGAIVALVVARMRGVSIVPKSRLAILWRSLLGTVAMLLTFYALSSRTVSLGDTATLIQLSPVFLAALAPIFLGERTTPIVALAIAISLAGVVLVTRPAFLFSRADPITVSTVGPSATVTTVTAVSAALSAAIAMMLLRRAGQTETAEAIAFNYSIFAAWVLGALALFDLRIPTARDALCMVGAGIAGGLGQLAMTRAYSLEHAAKVGGMSYLSVVASALLGALAFGEIPGPIAIAGMGLVIGGGLLVTTRPC
jgi:drug/metabolite transporter (DMT)-like permease